MDQIWFWNIENEHTSSNKEEVKCFNPISFSFQHPVQLNQLNNLPHFSKLNGTYAAI